LNQLLNNVKGLKVKDKVTKIEQGKNTIFLVDSDLNKLNKEYERVLSIYEAEKYISINDDKMQSCYFYESTRNTDQNVDGVKLRFALYIVHNYSGKKYFRLS
jgi:hypothetical protein